MARRRTTKKKSSAKPKVGLKAKTASRKARPRSRKAKARRKSWWRRLSGRWMARLVALAFLLLLVSGGYVLYLDHVVRVKFEGKRWALPAHVYARPLELYAGAPVAADQFAWELARLGYQKGGERNRSGTYSRTGGRFRVHVRGFSFWDGEQPPQVVSVDFSASQVSRLTAQGGKAVSLLRLDPQVIGGIYPTHNEDRVLLRREEIPEVLVATLLAVEDRGFYEHGGIDYWAIARAMWANIRAGGVVQGGSTLTQQLVKNFYLSSERSLLRKANEAVMALLLERRYAKDEILEAYANEIYLGQDGKRAIHGFGLASHFYFGRPLEELDLPRLALMVGMVRGPSYYDPRRHQGRAKKRRDLVLGLMRDQNLISAEVAKAAQKAGLGVTPRAPRGSSSFPAFMDLVRRQLHRDYREEDLTSEGLRIFTTLDPWVQDQAEKSVTSRLVQLEKSRKLAKGRLEAAAVIASAASGEIEAVVGGRETRYSGFNRALDAVRPAGSLIKPLVYLAALEEPSRYTLLTELDDGPLSLTSRDGQVWKPNNYDKTFHGQVPLHEALAHSYNLATVRLGLAVGVERVIGTLRDLGIRRDVQPYPSLFLGAADFSPLELAQVYQGLAAGGFYSPLRAIREVLDVQGRPLQRYPLTVRQAAPAEAVYVLNTALQEVVREGTGKALGRYLPASLAVAGKTGTTNDLRDSWFAGFAGDRVAVVWVGRDDNKPAGFSGASGALTVWGEMMRRVRPRPLEMSMPESVELVWIHQPTGLRADRHCEGARPLAFVRGSAPTRLAPCMSGIERAGSRIKGLIERIFE